ncbi:MAG TPA: hypothetical protein VMQ62_05110 [Dongiaceae bacterium]|nr:hypothetical protein [Dongiaceae bacterium]
MTGTRGLVWFLLGAAAMGGVEAARAGHAPATPAQAERVVLENPRVRVLEYTSEPGGGVCGAGEHSHPAHLTVVMAAARDREVAGGSAPQTGELKVGDVLWSEAGTHTDENIGTTASRLLVVEIK